MADQSLFDNPQQEQTPADQPQTLFTIGDRAYDADGARTKIENADNFINTLKSEKQDLDAQLAALRQQNAELEAQVAQSTKLEDALSMFNQTHQQQHTQPQQEQTPSLDVEALKASLEADIFNKIQASEMAKVQEANFGQSMSAAQKAFGSDVAAKLQERGAQLGMDTKAIDQLAKTQPAVFNELFIPKPSASHSHPDGSSIHGKPSATLNEVVDNWGDRDKFWSSQSKAESLRKMTEEVSKLIREGKIDPNAKNFF